MSIRFTSLVDFFRNRNVMRSCPRNQVIITQGDPFTKVFMIKSGMVKMYDLDQAGNERTINIFSQYNIFPVTWLVASPPPHYLYFYEAFTSVDCYVAPLEAVQEHLSSHPELLAGLTDSLAKEYLNLIARVQNLEKSHLPERLQFVLYFLANRLGDIDGNIASIETAITQEDIARLAGVTRESISIEINKAERRGLIWKDYHKTFIDLSLIDVDSMPSLFSTSDSTHDTLDEN